jgi:hypothetical protein
MPELDQLRDVASGFGTGQRGRQSAEAAGELVWKRWAALVDKRLRSTRQTYKEGMRIDVGQGRITLRLVGSLANKLEWGADPYDLREVLLQREGAPWPKRSRAGHLYRPIFLQKTASQIQAAGGWAAYRKLAIRLEPSVRRSSGTTWGRKLGPGLAPRLKPHHASDPLAGLYRMKRGPGGRAYYGTFRTISWGAKPWMHPGFKAQHLMLEAAKLIPQALTQVRR